MTLYAANVMDIAKPIEKKGKKAKKLEAIAEEAPAPPPTPVLAKKELTEKQLAALEKRKRKREEAVAAKTAEEEAIRAKEEEIRAKEEELARKKEEAKEKRRLAREARKTEVKQEVSPPTSAASEASDEIPVKAKKSRKNPDMEPPAWFQKYVAGVKSEEAKQSASKVPKKEVLEVARQTAQQQWNDGLTRDRIQNEVDSHMSRMYGMIFNNRRFK